MLEYLQWIRTAYVAAHLNDLCGVSGDAAKPTRGKAQESGDQGKRMKIKLAVEIFCRPEEVFPWIAEPDKAMRWQKGVKGGEIIKETPGKIGTTFREEMEENGNSIVMHGEITNYIQDQLITFHLESRIHRVDVSYSIVGNDNKSTFTVESTIYWKFPMNMISLIIGRKIKEGILRQTESEFAELKRLCETKPADFE